MGNKKDVYVMVRSSVEVCSHFPNIYILGIKILVFWVGKVGIYCDDITKELIGDNWLDWLYCMKKNGVTWKFIFEAVAWWDGCYWIYKCEYTFDHYLQLIVIIWSVLINLQTAFITEHNENCIFFF